MNLRGVRFQRRHTTRDIVSDDRVTCLISHAFNARSRKPVEVVWMAANCVLPALPIGAIVLNVYGTDLKASVLAGMHAAVAEKVIAVFEQAIYTTLSCVVVCALSLLRGFDKKRPWGAFLWTAVAILILSVLIDNKMGTVGADSLAEIFCTNLRETTAYGLQALSTMNISSKQLAVAMSPAAFYWLLALLSRLFALRPNLTLAKFSLTLSATAFMVLFARDVSLLVSAYKDGHVVQRRLRQATREQINSFSRPRYGPRLVVYIGESTNRELYRALAGRLERRPYKANVLLFEQVISPHSHTTPSLLRELTISDDPSADQLKYDTELWRANLISVLNQKGVGTEWYSNQAQDEWPAKLFGEEANRKYFQKQAWGSSFTGSRKPDSEFLPNLLHALKTSEQSAIFFHSYAGHFPYCDNLPATPPSASPDVRTTLPFKAVFGDLFVLNPQRHAEEINCYGRALDSISTNLDSVMQEMWNATEPIVLVYFSDHGEDVLDGTGHESGSATYRKIEVPLVVFFNAAARRQYGTEFDAASANRVTPYSLAWISDSLSDIAGVGCKRDLLSIFRRLDRIPDRYSLLRVYQGKRFVIPVDADHEAQGVDSLTDIDLYAKRRLIHSLPATWQNRICAHRADSWMKFNEASQAFSCLEIDLVIDAADQQVYVFHPPKANSYLTLKDLMSGQPGGWSKLWLDTKNLNQSNAGFYLQYLNALFPPTQRSGILIETSLNTPNDALLRSMLADFRDSGYGLSYYLPTGEAIRCSQSPAATGCRAFADQALATISTLPFTSLSFDVRAKPVARAIQQRRNIQLNTWDTNLRRRSDLDSELLGEVNMYLVPYHSRFDY